MNRSVRGATLFECDVDYLMLERVLLQALQRYSVRVFAYCVMPNHWHLIVHADSQEQLSAFMHWFEGTHAKRWHTIHGTTGSGPVYKGRFKHVAIDSDRQFFTTCRYVERNPLEGGLVARAEDWRWSSLWRHCNNCHDGFLHQWPFPRPQNWLSIVNDPQSASPIADVERVAVTGLGVGPTASGIYDSL